MPDNNIHRTVRASSISKKTVHLTVKDCICLTALLTEGIRIKTPAVTQSSQQRAEESAF